MRIAIIGIGAMGSLFSAHLSPLADVRMIGSWREQLDALRQWGVTLATPDGRQRQVTVFATDDVNELGAADVALILVKSYRTEAAAEVAERVLSPDGVALTLQNGYGNCEKVAAWVGESRAALGVTSEGATMIAPGLVRHAGRGQTYLARKAGAAGMWLEAMAEMLGAAGLETYLVDHADELLWRKLAVNAGINPLTTLLNVANGFLAEHEVARQMMIQAAQETAAVARAQGLALSDDEVAQQVLKVSQATAGNVSSMLQDRRRGAPTEIDAIAGAITQIGERYRVPTPVNRFLWQKVKEVEIGDWRLEMNDPISNLQSLISALAKQ